MTPQAYASDVRDFVRQVTTVGVASLVPELSLRLAVEPIAPWAASESRFGSVQPPPFWAHAWPGGLVLARLVLDEPALVRGLRVLDFASGGGVSAIAAAKAGAAEVTATELDPLAIAAIEENAALNQVTVRVSCEDVIGRDDGWDTVLVGDVFYQVELSGRVMAWLRQLHERGAHIRIGDPGRSFLPMDELECVATFTVPPAPAWDSVVDRPARVWRLVKERGRRRGGEHLAGPSCTPQRGAASTAGEDCSAQLVVALGSGVGLRAPVSAAGAQATAVP